LKYSFHPAAEAELNQAVDYYDECQTGLGLEFLKEILPHRPKHPRISPCVVTSFTKYQKVFVEAFPLWSRIPASRRGGIHNCGHEPQQRTWLLEEQRKEGITPPVHRKY
jgi:hypothetical protein